MLYDKLDVSGLFWSIEERYSPRDDGTRVTPKRKALHLVNHLPRSIRARVARASAHSTKNHRRRTSSSDGSGSPHQEGARSPTGRVALGPWTGPFEAHPGSPTSSALTLYLDMDGHCYESLTSKDADSAQSSKRGHIIVRSQRSQLNAMLAEVVAAKAAAALAASPALTPQMMMMANGNGSHRRHAYHAHDAPAQWAPARGQRTRKMMGISQPRSSYY